MASSRRGPHGSGDGQHHRPPRREAPSVGTTRNLGLFGILDLVRSARPLDADDPFNGTIDEMKAIGAFLRKHGVYTITAPTTRSTPTRPCASPKSSSPRGSRSSTRPSTSPTRRSPADRWRTTGPIDLLPQVDPDRVGRTWLRPLVPVTRAPAGSRAYVLFGLGHPGGHLGCRSSSFGGVPWHFENVARDAHRHRTLPAVPLGVRVGPEPAPTGSTSWPRWAAPVQRNAEGDSLGQFLVGAAFYTWREAVHRVRRSARCSACCWATVFVHSRAGRACLRAVCRRQPDDPDRGARADDRLRVRAERDTRSWSSRPYLLFFPVTIADDPRGCGRRTRARSN